MKTNVNFYLFRMSIASALFLLSPALSKADVIINFNEIGPDVVATATGFANLTDLTSAGSASTSAFIQPASGPIALVGSPTSVSFDIYSGLTSPGLFGTGAFAAPTSGSSGLVGIDREELYVAAGYTSMSAISEASTYAGQSFATLGLTPGSYTWTWGAGANADSLTLNVSTTAAAVPEPSTLAVLSIGAIGLIGYRRRILTS